MIFPLQISELSFGHSCRFNFHVKISDFVLIAFQRAVDLNVFAGKVRSASCCDEGICIRIMNGASRNQRLNVMLRSSTTLLKEPC